MLRALRVGVQNFIGIPVGANLIKPTIVDGEAGWYEITAKFGDKNPGDDEVRRVGWDGYVYPFINNDLHVRFKIRFGDNCITSGADWLKLHAFRDVDDTWQQSGPLRLTIEGSTPQMRVHHQTVTSSDGIIRSTTDITDTLYTIMPNAETGLGNVQADVTYDVEITGRVHKTRGFLHIKINDVPALTLPAVEGAPFKFGFGPRTIYPQQRIYSNARPGVGAMKLKAKLYDVSTEPSPVEPGIPWTLADLGSRLVYYGDDPAALAAVSASDNNQTILTCINFAPPAGNKTILGSSGSGGRQFVISTDRLAVGRQNVGSYGGYQSAGPFPAEFTNILVGVQLRAGQRAIYITHTGAIVEGDLVNSATFAAGMTTVVGEKAGGTEQLNGIFVGKTAILTGSLTTDELKMAMGYIIHDNPVVKSAVDDSFAYKLYPPTKTVAPIELGDKLLAWWDADDDTAFTLVDGAVAEWRDWKHDYALTQSVPANRPLFSATGFNGEPCVTFDGTNDMLELAPSPLPGGAAPYEVWVILEDLLPGSTATQAIAFSVGDAGSTRRTIYRLPSGGNNRVRIGAGNGSTEILAANGTNLAGRSVVRAVWDGTNQSVSLNNNAAASAAVVPATSSARLRLGASPGGTPSLFFNGRLREIVVTSLLSTEEAAAMATYMLGRRAI